MGERDKSAWLADDVSCMYQDQEGNAEPTSAAAQSASKAHACRHTKSNTHAMKSYERGSNSKHTANSAVVRVSHGHAAHPRTFSLSLSSFSLAAVAADAASCMFQACFSLHFRVLLSLVREDAASAARTRKERRERDETNDQVQWGSRAEMSEHENCCEKERRKHVKDVEEGEEEEEEEGFHGHDRTHETRCVWSHVSHAALFSHSHPSPPTLVQTVVLREYDSRRPPKRNISCPRLLSPIAVCLSLSHTHTCSERTWCEQSGSSRRRRR